MSADDLTVAVVGKGLFIPGFAGVPAWTEQTRSPDAESPRGALIKPRDRRRASLLTKALADCYQEALTESKLDPATVASVFGSALGEASTMIGLLDQIWKGEESLSPMRFVTSVHNAAAGVVSIATQNRSFTTSLGADYDTPAMALTEAVGWVLAHHESAIFACGDEAAPGDLVPDGLGWELFAGAIALSPVDAAAAGSPRIRLSGPSDSSIKPSSSVELGRNPNAGLLDLIQALETRSAGVLRLDRGLGQGFTVVIEPGE